jgi:hypothetical protein
MPGGTAVSTRLTKMLVLAAPVVSLSACTTTSNPYPASSRGGGWENFRADAPFGRSSANSMTVST